MFSHEGPEHNQAVLDLYISRRLSHVKVIFRLSTSTSSRITVDDDVDQPALVIN